MYLSCSKTALLINYLFIGLNSLIILVTSAPTEKNQPFTMLETSYNYKCSKITTFKNSEVQEFASAGCKTLSGQNGCLGAVKCFNSNNMLLLLHGIYQLKNDNDFETSSEDRPLYVKSVRSKNKNDKRTYYVIIDWDAENRVCSAIAVAFWKSKEYRRCRQLDPNGTIIGSFVESLSDDSESDSSVSSKASVHHNLKDFASSHKTKYEAGNDENGHGSDKSTDSQRGLQPEIQRNPSTGSMKFYSPSRELVNPFESSGRKSDRFGSFSSSGDKERFWSPNSSPPWQL